MKSFMALHNFMKQHFPRTVRDEVLCSCGAGNHVKLLFFRVNGRPSTVVFREGKDLSPDQLAHSLGGAQVELLSEHELNTVVSDSKLGNGKPFENAFGMRIYLDQRLLTCTDLVFCPRMFLEQQGECFRAPTREFLELSGATVVSLPGAYVQEKDAWEA